MSSEVTVDTKNVRVTDEDNTVIVSEIQQILTTGGGSSAGSQGEVQYSDGNGGFSASANLFWDSSNNRLGVNTTSPRETSDFLGNAQVKDDEGSNLTKAYRFRTSGGALDLEGGGKDLYISVWENPDFSGAQHNMAIFSASGYPTQIRRDINMRSNNISNVEYVNFGTTIGSSGYGIRDNNGTMQFKNDGDTGWTNMS
jgi:hypothetical protein